MSCQKTVLIVEDNEVNRAILFEILCGQYQVLEASNGLEALAVLREQKDAVSLILLDVMMPVMDGFAFLDHIRKDPDLSSIPVIVTTQNNSEADELAALHHGATDFVPKPYRPQIILHRAAALIKLRETAAMVNQLQHDPLTGLYTNAYFIQRVRERLQEDPDGDYCIVCSNIEHFKLVNDIFGRQKGDELLKEMADLLRQNVGDTGFCGRLGADRFLVFQQQDIERQARRAFEASEIGLSSPLFKNIVLHYGIYEILDRTLSVEQMCDRAVLAVDSIRHQYQRRFAVYDDSLRNKLLREQNITSAMEDALREEQFIVYLQPKYDLKDQRIAGAEALVRWIHPEWGFMSPGEFIPLFERNGFISRLDQYVREKVCAQLCRWQEKGYPLLPISVNISRADVFQGDLPLSILALTQKYGIDPKYLHLEITESAYTESPEQIISTVHALRQLGFIMEMDDFGSGYSSLNMLSQMSLDVLKLDMKFIQNELAKPVERSFLGPIISMAHQAGLRVVAEGVETREQLERLRAEGCDYVQGYYLARPMPAAEYEKLLLS